MVITKYFHFSSHQNFDGKLLNTEIDSTPLRQSTVFVADRRFLKINLMG